MASLISWSKNSVSVSHNWLQNRQYTDYVLLTSLSLGALLTPTVTTICSKIPRDSSKGRSKSLMSWIDLEGGKKVNEFAGF